MNEEELLKQAIQQAQQNPQPQRPIPFGPVPMSWSISQAHSAEGTVVVVHVMTPEGDKVFFLNPTIAKQVGEALVKQSSLAESGLIVPQ